MARTFGTIAAALLPCVALAGNPIVPGVGMADPHVHYFNSTFYLYATHDYSPNNTGFRMDDWWVWSSPDLVNWTKESVLLPQNTPSPPDAWQECWATDGATRNGSYYFYLSIGPDQVAVVSSSESPTGPWVSPLSVPMLNRTLGADLVPPTTIRDPCVFHDPADDTHYIVFGTFNYYIARLSPDMVTLAEPPRYLTVINPTGPYGAKLDDKPFLHKGDNGLYYLSWGCFYGVSNSPYGPYTYTGSVVSTDSIDPAFRMNKTQGPWYGWEDYADRHGSFWSAQGQWYYACNDRSHSTDVHGSSYYAYYRDTVISYVHYYANGSMAPVRIDAVGVGQYDGSHGAVIEAEDYWALRSAVVGGSNTGSSAATSGAARACSTASSPTAGGTSSSGEGGAYKGHDASGSFGIWGIRAADSACSSAPSAANSGADSGAEGDAGCAACTSTVLEYRNVHLGGVGADGKPRAAAADAEGTGVPARTVPAAIVLRTANGGLSPVWVVARRDSASGPILCTAEVQPRPGDWETHSEVECALQQDELAMITRAARPLNLVLTFAFERREGGERTAESAHADVEAVGAHDREALRLDSFYFRHAAATTM